MPKLTDIAPAFGQVWRYGDEFPNTPMMLVTKEGNSWTVAFLHESGNVNTGRMCGLHADPENRLPKWKLLSEAP